MSLKIAPSRSQLFQEPRRGWEVEAYTHRPPLIYADQAISIIRKRWVQSTYRRFDIVMLARWLDGADGAVTHQASRMVRAFKCHVKGGKTHGCWRLAQTSSCLELREAARPWS